MFRATPPERLALVILAIAVALGLLLALLRA
jgi:hypothetical protein